MIKKQRSEGVDFPLGHESQLMRESRENAVASRRWRINKALRRMQATNDAIRAAALDEVERSDAAKRDLEQHARDLAIEVRYRQLREEPNPWLQPGDAGYVSPEEFAVRRRLGA